MFGLGCALINSAYVSYLPKIVIVPGLIPPIVEPVGNVIALFCEEITASPIYIVFCDT